MDARSLLRAKKAEARVEHPYATYSASGQLRCTVCAVPVTKWDAHLLTKSHRTAAARDRDLQEKAIAAKAAKAAAKRPTPASAPSPHPAKRARHHSEPQDEEEDEEEGGGGGPSLPAGFFSSGQRPAVAEAEEEPPKPVAKTGDAELDDFLSSLTGAEDAPAPAPAPTAASRNPPRKGGYRGGGGRDDDEVGGVASYEAAPVRILRAGEKGAEEEKGKEEEEQETETEQERRARLAREEREEIMGRLEEEERAQEDADSRVLALKARMEMLKKRREGKAAAGSKAKVGKGVNGA